MNKEDKKTNEKTSETRKLNLDELEKVSGGSLRNAPKEKTHSSSRDTKSKV